MGHGAATEGVENGIRIPPRDFYPVCPPPFQKLTITCLTSKTNTDDFNSFNETIRSRDI